MDTEIDKAVSKLRDACGFRNSESATESFLDVLADAVKRTGNLTEILWESTVADIKKGEAL